MSGLLVNGNDGDERVVVEGRSGQTAVSMQVYQDIYNHITGKTEQIQKIYKNPFLVEFSDIEQLDLKIKQIFEQWHVKTSNCQITLYLEKDQKETFSSLERFKVFNQGTPCITESLLMQYQFMVVPPLTGRAQNYIVTIKLTSRITTLKKLRDEFPIGAPAMFLSMISARTAEIKIEFVDYVVARTILSVFDEWAGALSCSTGSEFIKHAKRVSHFIPIAFEGITSILVFIYIFDKIPAYIKPDIVDLQIFAYFIFCSLASLILLFKIAGSMGRFVENSIDSIIDLSYVKLTKGDDKHINNSVGSNRIEIVKAVTASAATFILNLLAKYFASRY